MRKYIPSILTKEIKKFYIVPTIGIDWDPGVSYNIGIYAGTVSFQLEWNYGPPLYGTYYERHILRRI